MKGRQSGKKWGNRRQKVMGNTASKVDSKTVLPIGRPIIQQSRRFTISDINFNHLLTSWKSPERASR